MIYILRTPVDVISILIPMPSSSDTITAVSEPKSTVGPLIFFFQRGLALRYVCADAQTLNHGNSNAHSNGCSNFTNSQIASLRNPRFGSSWLSNRSNQSVKFLPLSFIANLYGERKTTPAWVLAMEDPALAAYNFAQSTSSAGIRLPPNHPP